MNKLTIIAATGLITAGVVTAVGVLADGNPATDAVPRRIPYKGTLEKDGAAYTGTMTMKFSLYDGTSAASSWTETQTVTVYGGKFQALLGAASTTSATSLDTLVKNGDDLYLSITLATGNGDVVLSNKQRFYPVPYSTWAASAADFSVAGALTVSGATTAKSGVTVTGADNTGSAASIVVQTSSDVYKMYIDDNEIDTTYDYLHLNGNSKKLVKTGDDLTVGGDATVTSTLSVGTTLSVTGTAGVAGGSLSMSNGTSNLLSFANAGVAAPVSGSAGWKIKTYGNNYGIGIATNTQWYAASKNHAWYTTADSGATFTKRLTLDDAGKLTMTGALQPVAGNSSAAGIQWASNIGGGSGDEAYIRYYAESGENTKLVIANDNDDNDDIVLRQGGTDRIQLVSGKLGYVGCPSGFTLKNSICYEREETGTYWMNAQSICMDRGGHVCTMAEIFKLWGSGTDSCSGPGKDGDWLGDLVSDDVALGQNGCNKYNFEGDNSDKKDSRPYVCCLNLR